MSRIAKTDVLRRELQEQLLRRKWPAGTAIPSEHTLAERYGISRPSVRKVLGEFCQTGVLERRMGKGTFVRDALLQQEPALDQPLLIGTDSIGTGNSYYTSIAKALRNSGYGRHIFLNLLNADEISTGQIQAQVKAFLFARDLLPESVYQEISRLHLPVAHINRQCDYPEVGYATIDHTKEAERAVDTLFQAGRRRIMLLARDDRKSLSVQLRARGWENACRKWLGSVPEELRNPVFPDSPGDFPQWLESLRPDAFFCVNAAQYERFQLDYARCTGQMPDGCSVIVFDDMDDFYPGKYPQLNFIRMPIERITQLCIEYLWQKHRDPALPPLRAVLPCDLVLRTDLK